MMSLMMMITTPQNKEKKKRNKKEISLLKVVLYVQVRKGMYKNVMAKIWKQILSCFYHVMDLKMLVYLYYEYNVAVKKPHVEISELG